MDKATIGPPIRVGGVAAHLCIFRREISKLIKLKSIKLIRFSPKRNTALILTEQNQRLATNYWLKLIWIKYLCKYILLTFCVSVPVGRLWFSQMEWSPAPLSSQNQAQPISVTRKEQHEIWISLHPYNISVYSHRYDNSSYHCCEDSIRIYNYMGGRKKRYHAWGILHSCVWDTALAYTLFSLALGSGNTYILVTFLTILPSHQ